MLRSLLVAAIVFALVPVTLVRPWIGVLLWTWLSYMNPHRLTYGFAYDFPFAMIVGGTTLVGLLFSRERRRLPPGNEVVLLAVLWLIFLLSTLFSPFYPQEAWAQLGKVSKILLMTFVTMMLIQSRARLAALMGVVAFSLGFFGLKGGVWGILTGAQHHVLGPPGSFLAGNTEIGLALNMNLPILYFLRREVSRVWVRRLMLAAFVFSIAAILITYSRGALLGLVGVLGYLVWTGHSRWKALALVALAIPLALAFLPEQWLSRMYTIQTYEEDASAMGRIHTWILATRIAADRPLLGAGFRCFTNETSLRYMPESPYPGFDAHNIFFQVLAEHGLLGILAFTALIASTWGTLGSILRRTRKLPQAQWIHNYALMIRGSLTAYLVSGFFLSLSYFDLFYLLVAATVILKTALAAVPHRREAPAQPAAARVPAFP